MFLLIWSDFSIHFIKKLIFFPSKSLQPANLHALTTSPIGISHARPNRFGARIDETQHPLVAVGTMSNTSLSMAVTLACTTPSMSGPGSITWLFFSALRRAQNSVAFGFRHCGMALRFDLPSLL